MIRVQFPPDKRKLFLPPIGLGGQALVFPPTTKKIHRYMYMKELYTH